MTSEVGGEAGFRTWLADGWDDLRSIWAQLIPDIEGAEPTFRTLRLSAQQKGWVFERWVMEAFRWSQASIDHRYSNPMGMSANTLEEIDGLIFDGWQGFLVEAKCETKAIAIDPIFRLHLMAEQRPIGTMGLMFSSSGYTRAAIELTERLRPIRILLFDQVDLAWALQSEGSMIGMVRRKWIFALRSGRPYIPVTSLADYLQGT